MHQLQHPRPRLAALLAAPGAMAGKADPELLFWRPEVGVGVGSLLAQLAPLDALAQHVEHLPLSAVLTRPVVGQYLSMFKTVAAAWPLASRPSLLAALGALTVAGAALDVPVAHDALAAPDGGRVALRAADALQRRLAGPLAALHSLLAGLQGYQTQLASLALELDTDTRLVTQRLQADHVHVLMLSQQASLLERRLDRQLAAPHAAGEQIGAGASALAELRRQLGQLRGEQAATIAEADYLHGLGPTLAPYRSALEGLQRGMSQLAGSISLQVAALARAEPALVAAAAPGMPGARQHWTALAASLASAAA